MTDAATILRAALLGLVVLAAPAQALDRRDTRPAADAAPYGVEPSVGRNAGPAIADGLGGLGAGWLDTIGNALADPVFRDADYFDDYRRRTYGAVRRR